jgi:hypothetical protein
MKRMLFNLLIVYSFFSLMMIPELFARDKDPLAGESLFRDVVFYSSLGDHRTATPSDRVTALWIGHRLKKAGLKVRTQEWDTRQFYPLRTEVIIDKTQKIKAFPVWWPKPTPPWGIEAPMTRDKNDVNGKIYLFVNRTPATFSITPALAGEIHAVAANGALAMVVVNYYNGQDTVASDEFIGLNAIQETRDEWPIPVVSAMAGDQQALDEAILDQSAVKVVSTGRYNNHAKALNVIGALDRGPESKVMVVSTPYSGWFTCAGERGSGVAIFLAIAEWAAQNTSDITWIFTATSGHEIHGSGVKYYLDSELAPDPLETFSWTHIGAWQAMYSFLLENEVLVPTGQMDRRIFQYREAALPPAPTPLKNVVDAKFKDPALNLIVSPRIMYGDLLDVSPYGYNNLFGISGAHEYHHSTQDLPPVTGPDILEPMARAYQEALEMLMDYAVEQGL